MAELRIVPPAEARAELWKLLDVEYDRDFKGQPSHRVTMASGLSQALEGWEQAERKAAALGEQRDAALALHVDTMVGNEGWCDECGVHLPCPTARALGVES